MDRRLGAQLYTVRNEMKTLEGFREGIKKLAGFGYKVVQVSGIPLKAADMKKVFDEYGMECAFTHRNFADFQKDLPEIIDYNKTLGCDSACIGSAPREYLLSDDGVSRFIEEMNRIADTLSENGMFFGYHNHCFEFVKRDGKTIMERLLSESDPKKVQLVLDTFWVQCGGVDPGAFIRSVKGRAEFIHFKDYAVDPEDLMTRRFAEIGYGNLDWDDIIAACDEAGSRIALVEQDDCYGRDPYESLKMSYEFMKTKGFC